MAGCRTQEVLGAKTDHLAGVGPTHLPRDGKWTYRDRSAQLSLVFNLPWSQETFAETTRLSQRQTVKESGSTVCLLLEYCPGVSAFCPLKGIYAVWEEILSAVLLLTCFSPTPFNPTRMTSIHGVRHTKAKAREDCWLSRKNFDSGQ